MRLLWRDARSCVPPQQAHVLLNAIAIHPGSGGARKCWPVECFAEVIKRLWQRDYAVLLLAGPADSARLHAIQQLLPSPPSSDLFTILENAPLLQVAQQLSSCACYLGNDSGITHLAALLGLPTLALFWSQRSRHMETSWSTGRGDLGTASGAVTYKCGYGSHFLTPMPDPHTPDPPCGGLTLGVNHSTFGITSCPLV